MLLEPRFHSHVLMMRLECKQVLLCAGFGQERIYF